MPLDNVISNTGHVNSLSNGEDKNIKGSTFLTAKDFKPIIVKTIGNKVGKYSQGTFNVKTGQFIVKKADGKLVAIDDSLVKEVVFLGNSFKKIDGEYYAFLSEGEISFLKKYKLDVVNGSVDPLSKEKVTPDKYVIKELYFTLNKGQSPKTIKLKKKNILKLFTKEQVAKIKKMVKEKKLSYKKERDLKLLFNIVNQ